MFMVTVYFVDDHRAMLSKGCPAEWVVKLDRYDDRPCDQYVSPSNNPPSEDTLVEVAGIVQQVIDAELCRTCGVANRLFA